MSRVRAAACAAISTLALLTLSACGAADGGGSAKQASKENQADIIKHITKGEIVSRSGDGGADDTTPVAVTDGSETVLVCTDANLQGLCSNLPVPSNNLVNSFFSANDMSTNNEAETSTNFNDSISYIFNTSSSDAICFYENTDFTGKVLKVVPGDVVNNLNPEGKKDGLNDRISSIQNC
ncbi:peptidase inhibitor family I36 protein [Streptomyces sp. NPDC013157]|uniref:peptidase inhibitor family I36 protein n=1 Tax=Streptomyces sp. NPDC013157 TaxID=3364861 RepID=UPI00368C3D29